MLTKTWRIVENMDGFYMNKQVTDLYIKLEEVKETLDKSERLNTDEKIENLLKYESNLNENIRLLENHKSNLNPNSKFYKTFNYLSIEYNNTRFRLNKIVNNLEEFDTSESISDKNYVSKHEH